MAETTDTNKPRFGGSWKWGGWYFRAAGWLFHLKGPRVRALFSERNRRNVRVIPIGFGWRINIRRDGANG